MHRVECPNCHKSLKLPKAVSNVRLKCSKCGEVFVGSSHWDGPGEPPSDAGQAQAQSSPAGEVDSGDAPISLENFGQSPAKKAAPPRAQTPPAKPPQAKVASAPRPLEAGSQSPQPRQAQPPQPRPEPPQDEFPDPRREPAPRPQSLSSQMTSQNTQPRQPQAMSQPVRPRQASSGRARPRSKTPAIVAVVLAVLLIPIVIGLWFVMTHKHVILKDANGNTVADRGWMTDEEAKKAIEEFSGKSEKADKPSPARPAEDIAKPKPKAKPTGSSGDASGGNVSDSGLVGAQVQGDKEFAIESERIIPDEIGEGGTYTGLVVNRRNTVIESVTLTLKCGQMNLKPVTLSWVAPNGRVPFTVNYSALSADQRKQAPIAVFSDVKLRTDMVGWDIPSAEPIDTVSEDKATITVTGIATNRTGAAVRSAKLYAVFITEEGVIQGAVNGELKQADLTPDAKSDYTVTYNPTLIGQPHKFYLRVIGTK